MIEIVSIVFGLAGIAFGVHCYTELRKWARLCQNARIAIAFKGRVKMQAPLTEWVTWANMLGRDEQSAGRVVWAQGGASVAITRPMRVKRPKTRLAIRQARRARKGATV